MLNLTDDTVLSELTRLLIAGVKLFDKRINLNNASVGTKSASSSRSPSPASSPPPTCSGSGHARPRAIDTNVANIVETRGKSAVRRELRDVFTQVATRFGGLERVGFVNSVGADFQGNPEPAGRPLDGEVANAGGSPNEGALLAVSVVGRAGRKVPAYDPEAIASAPPLPSPGHR